MGPVASFLQSPVRSPTLASSAPPRLGELLHAPGAARGPVRTPADVGGRAAWDVLVRDGVLEVVRGDAAVAAGTPLTAADRAGLLRGAVPTGAVVGGRTAAWVHGGRPLADGGVLDLTYPAGGHRPAVWGPGLVWQSPLLRDDVTTHGRVRVTGPVRTIVDLALRLEPDDATRRVVALAGACAVDLREVRRQLERRVRAVGRPQAREVLDRAETHLGAVWGPLP